MPEIEIRDATAHDALAACEVIRRSISELCVADHANDSGILKRWLSNKTPENVASWIARPDSSVLVAVEHGCDPGGGLCYRCWRDYLELRLTRCEVSRYQSRAPERARGQSARKGKPALHAHQHGDSASLYSCNGYAEDSSSPDKFGTAGSYAMSKSIVRVQNP